MQKASRKGPSLQAAAVGKATDSLAAVDGAAAGEEEQPADTAFFHKFFELKAQGQASRLKSKKRTREEALIDDDDSLADSDASSEAVGELHTYELTFGLVEIEMFEVGCSIAICFKPCP